MALKRFALALLLAALAGCATTTVQHAPAAPATPAAFIEARGLAAGLAGLPWAEHAGNTARIEALLAGLDGATLAREAAALPQGDALYDFAGRALLNRGLPLPRPFDRSGWRFDTAGRPPAEPDGYRPPLKVAVLLPLSGNLATAAAPVRDGFLSGYYGERRRRPELRFYDTAGGASAAYARAVAEGSDFVVGPLGREEVDAAFANAAPAAPMLALNRGNRMPPDGSASFSLSPEDEGVEIAEFLLERGARNVLVIAGSEDAQRRAAATLRQHLQQRGAHIAASLDYVGDAPPALPPNAGSEVDAVFLALKAAQARALAPQLALAGLAGKTRVATSQVAVGAGTPEEGAGLDGIVYPTERWNLHGIAGLPSRDSVAGRLNTAKGPAGRLFAFGYDAWLLTAYLERLALSANADLPGATGVLRLDGFGNVLRRPAWSRFVGGVPALLDDGAR